MTWDEITLESPNFSTRTVNDGAMTATVATLTSATATFTLADEGRTVSVAGAGVAGATLVTTIATFVGVTEVTLTVAASTTVSNATTSIYSGTMIRLPTGQWSENLQDRNVEEVQRGRGEDPRKRDSGRYSEEWVIQGQLSAKTATDTAIWNPTIINGVIRTALANVYEYWGLLEDTRREWWEESATGNWHDDGNPGRARGRCRIRLDSKWDGSSTVPRYVYGYVARVNVGPVLASFKSSGTLPFLIIFRRANVVSTG